MTTQLRASSTVVDDGRIGQAVVVVGPMLSRSELGDGWRNRMDPPDDARGAPWWESGALPEPVFTGRWRRRRVPFLVAAGTCAVVFLGFFVWIGVAAQHA